MMGNYLRAEHSNRIGAGGMEKVRCGRAFGVAGVAWALLSSSAIVVRTRRKRPAHNRGLNPSASELRYARHAGTRPTSTPALSTTPM
jgi:hypothetical protein